jgi:hypothetical protein
MSNQNNNDVCEDVSDIEDEHPSITSYDFLPIPSFLRADRTQDDINLVTSATDARSTWTAVVIDARAHKSKKGNLCYFAILQVLSIEAEATHSPSDAELVAVKSLAPYLTNNNAATSIRDPIIIKQGDTVSVFVMKAVTYSFTLDFGKVVKVYNTKYSIDFAGTDPVKAQGRQPGEPYIQMTCNVRLSSKSLLDYKNELHMLNKRKAVMNGCLIDENYVAKRSLEEYKIAEVVPYFNECLNSGSLYISERSSGDKKEGEKKNNFSVDSFTYAPLKGSKEHESDNKDDKVPDVAAINAVDVAVASTSRSKTYVTCYDYFNIPNDVYLANLICNYYSNDGIYVYVCNPWGYFNGKSIKFNPPEMLPVLSISTPIGDGTPGIPPDRLYSFESDMFNKVRSPCIKAGSGSELSAVVGFFTKENGKIINPKYATLAVKPFYNINQYFSYVNADRWEKFGPQLFRSFCGIGFLSFNRFVENKHGSVDYAFEGAGSLRLFMDPVETLSFGGINISFKSVVDCNGGVSFSAPIECKLNINSLSFVPTSFIQPYIINLDEFTGDLNSLPADENYHWEYYAVIFNDAYKRLTNKGRADYLIDCSNNAQALSYYDFFQKNSTLSNDAKDLYFSELKSKNLEFNAFAVRVTNKSCLDD